MPRLTYCEFDIMQLFWQKGIKEATLDEIAAYVEGHDVENPFTLLRYLKVLTSLVNARFLSLDYKHDYVFFAICTRRYYVDHSKWWKRCSPYGYQAPHLYFSFWWLVEHLKRKQPEEPWPPDENPSA